MLFSFSFSVCCSPNNSEVLHKLLYLTLQAKEQTQEWQEWIQDVLSYVTLNVQNESL